MKEHDEIILRCFSAFNFMNFFPHLQIHPNPISQHTFFNSNCETTNLSSAVGALQWGGFRRPIKYTLLKYSLNRKKIKLPL